MMFKKPKRKVNKVFVHCSASDNSNHDDISVMRKWHKARGWSDVGYHYFIKKNGKIQKGRSLERIPASAAGHNRGTIAICLHGLDELKFTKEQFTSLYKLCSQIHKTYGEKSITFHGHCEVSKKTCPVFEYKRVLGLSRIGTMVSKPNLSLKSERIRNIKKYDLGSRTLRVTSSPGTDILWVQNRFGITADGIFGQQTKKKVIKFQIMKNLIPDGIIGIKTWKVLMSI